MRKAFLITALSLVAVIAVVIGTLFVTHAMQSDSGGSSGGGPPQPVAGADLSGSGPGSLVSAMTFPGVKGLARGVRAARVVYRSTNGDSNEPTEVSGSVFLPPGNPPDGGWPVVSFGHGTTGLDEPCAPSLSDTLLGMVTFVDAFTKKGFAVAFADYQGLGAPGVHPYTDARTAGLNMIDAVRALRNTYPEVSAKWAAFGGSQGGGAAWAAAEQAGPYASDLNLVGAVALAPAADVSGLVTKAGAGTMNRDQRPAMAVIVESLARLHPDLNRDDYRHGAAAKYWDTLVACSGPLVHDRTHAADEVQPGDLAPATPEAADRLRQLLQHWALPQLPLSAPLSVAYGDQDEFIDVQWTTDALARQCQLGGSVHWDLQPGKGHANLAISDQVKWLADRFQGKEAVSDCK